MQRRSNNDMVIAICWWPRYFETCHFLTTNLSPVERVERDEKFASTERQEDRSEFSMVWSLGC